MSHIVESCPLTKLNGGLSRLHSADEDAVSWLTSYGSWNAYEKKIGRIGWGVRVSASFKNAKLVGQLGPHLVADTANVVPADRVDGPDRVDLPCQPADMADVVFTHTPDSALY